MPNTKVCSKCNLKQDLSSFIEKEYKTKEGISSCIYNVCKSCDNKRNKISRLKEFSLDESFYNLLLLLQSNKCLICHEEEPKIDKRTGKRRNLAIDHDHNTGRFRGLLCSRCNIGLGLFKENINILKAALYYLERPIIQEKLIAQVGVAKLVKLCYNTSL